MKLAFVEACGFRGFRSKVRIDFGDAFTVISGKNGTGKSTVCDAVEFGLTGSIEKYAVEKAAGESLTDYLWWRGDGTPEAHYVTVAFRANDGTAFEVTRTRENGANRSAEEIENALCGQPRPDNALRQLCKTSIIRDEWIAALSLDLSEADRFELVRAALGPAEGVDYSIKAREVVSIAEATHVRREAAYNEARTRLTSGIAHLAEAKETIGRLGDVAAALEIVADATPNTADDIAGRLAGGRASLLRRRTRLNAMKEAAAQGHDIQARRREFDSPAAAEARAAARDKLDNAVVAAAQADAAVRAAEQALKAEEQTDAIAASLATLIAHGEKLGLHDERCPLCAAARTPEEFSAGLAIARARLEGLASGVTQARDQLATARQAASGPAAELELAQQSWRLIEQEQAQLTAREQDHIELFEKFELDFRFAQDPDGLEREAEAERNRLLQLESALQTLEASQLVSTVASLEEHLASLRRDVDELADGVTRSQTAVAAAKAIERSVKRIAGEIVDEKLAQISPLLNELYQRLRPHSDWRTIEYSVRGDVRRYLSLRVGDGLNPQFVFSSGQRRAAGLAFLLSVHLARAWSQWRTLLLDDPVQHIDDFRALQLVEVLAALRLDGRQIVCAVEDGALADLLCRRLSGAMETAGYRYEFSFGSSGAVVAAGSEVPPLPVGIMRAAPGIQAVS